MASIEQQPAVLMVQIWHIRLVNADGTHINPYQWLVRTSNSAADSWTEAITLIKSSGMLPTDYIDEQGNLLTGYELTPEIVEWESTGEVARLF